MRHFGRYDTHWLTRASFAPTADGRLRKDLVPALVALALVLVALLCSGYLGQRLAGPLRPLELRRQNASLSEQIERARTELDMERATRIELQRQADELSARVADLQRQLEFLTSRNGAAGRSR